MITNEMWGIAQNIFLCYPTLHTIYIDKDRDGGWRAYKSINDVKITRKQVEEHFKDAEPPKREDYPSLGIDEFEDVKMVWHMKHPEYKDVTDTNVGESKPAVTLCSYGQGYKLHKLGFKFEETKGKPVMYPSNEWYGPTTGISMWTEPIPLEMDLPATVFMPSLVIAAQWLREVKGLHVVTCPENKAHSCNWVYSIYLRSEKEKGWMCVVVSGIINPTHDAALSEGIDKALEILEILEK